MTANNSIICVECDGDERKTDFYTQCGGFTFRPKDGWVQIESFVNPCGYFDLCVTWLSQIVNWTPSGCRAAEILENISAPDVIQEMYEFTSYGAFVHPSTLAVFIHQSGQLDLCDAWLKVARCYCEWRVFSKGAAGIFGLIEAEAEFKQYAKRIASHFEWIGVLDAVNNHPPATEQKEKSQIGFVYLILDREAKCVKIGYSCDPESRLSNLQTANPHKLELVATTRGDYGLEKFFHKLCKKHHVSGEWFASEAIALLFEDSDIWSKR